MFIIQLLFQIFILIQKTHAFYNLKYGNIILDYYNTKDCVNNSIDQIIIPTIDDKGKVIKTLKVLNSEGEIVEYEYSFDFDYLNKTSLVDIIYKIEYKLK